MPAAVRQSFENNAYSISDALLSVVKASSTNLSISSHLNIGQSKFSLKYPEVNAGSRRNVVRRIISLVLFSTKPYIW